MEQQEENAPAWLVALGISDWQAEMELLTLSGNQGTTCQGTG